MEGVDTTGIGDAVRRALRANRADQSPHGCCTEAPISNDDSTSALRIEALCASADVDPHLDSPLMLAMQIHRYETLAPLLASGCSFVEERGVYSAAVQRGLLRCPRDLDAAFRVASETVEALADRRRLPDIVFIGIARPPTEASRTRADARAADRHRVWQRTAARLFRRLATADPQRFVEWPASYSDDASALDTWLRRKLPRRSGD